MILLFPHDNGNPSHSSAYLSPVPACGVFSSELCACTAPTGAPICKDGAGRTMGVACSCQTVVEVSRSTFAADPTYTYTHSRIYKYNPWKRIEQAELILFVWYDMFLSISLFGGCYGNWDSKTIDSPMADRGQYAESSHEQMSGLNGCSRVMVRSFTSYKSVK